MHDPRCLPAAARGQGWSSAGIASRLSAPFPAQRNSIVRSCSPTPRGPGILRIFLPGRRGPEKRPPVFRFPGNGRSLLSCLFSGQDPESPECVVYHPFCLFQRYPKARFCQPPGVSAEVQKWRRDRFGQGEIRPVSPRVAAIPGRVRIRRGGDVSPFPPAPSGNRPLQCGEYPRRSRRYMKFRNFPPAGEWEIETEWAVYPISALTEYAGAQETRTWVMAPTSLHVVRFSTSSAAPGGTRSSRASRRSALAAVKVRLAWL